MPLFAIELDNFLTSWNPDLLSTRLPKGQGTWRHIQEESLSLSVQYTYIRIRLESLSLQPHASTVGIFLWPSDFLFVILFRKGPVQTGRSDSVLVLCAFQLILTALFSLGKYLTIQTRGFRSKETSLSLVSSCGSLTSSSTGTVLTFSVVWHVAVAGVVAAVICCVDASRSLRSLLILSILVSLLDTLRILDFKFPRRRCIRRL